MIRESWKFHNITEKTFLAADQSSITIQIDAINEVFVACCNEYRHAGDQRFVLVCPQVTNVTLHS